MTLTIEITPAQAEYLNALASCCGINKEAAASRALAITMDHSLQDEDALLDIFDFAMNWSRDDEAEIKARFASLVESLGKSEEITPGVIDAYAEYHKGLIEEVELRERLESARTVAA